jgi:chromosome segregation ATPase
LVYRGVRLPNDTEDSDLHFKVERKSKKEKDVSVVHLIVGRSSENITLRHENDSHKSDDGKSFLNNLGPTVVAHQLEMDIKDQSEKVTKAEKKLKTLTEDQKEYEKKIANLQEKLVENKKDQENQTVEIQKQRDILQSLQSRKL